MPDMSLAEAIQIVKAHNEGGHDCLGCEQRIPLTRKETLNKHKVEMLKRAASHVKETMVNDFIVADFTEPEDFKRYNFFSHLRLHGLVFKQRDENGKEFRGRWGITRNGWAFLRGEKTLPSYVLIKNNHIEERSPLLVGFLDVWRGESTMETSFEYFDDAGQPVGFRPSMPVSHKTEQQRLI